MKTFEKKCTKCNKVCPATAEYFHRDKSKKTGLRPQCKKCCIKRQAKYQRTEKGRIVHRRADKKYSQTEKGIITSKKSIEKYQQSSKGKKYQQDYRKTKKGKEVNRQNKYRNRYGLDIVDYNQLFQQQNGHCAICGEHQSELKRKLDIDHDHKTGKIRGLLCRGCNRRLGRFENGRKFNLYLTQKFMEYLNG